jgi:hypothetical protein
MDLDEKIIDEQLHQLALEAQQHPVRSRQRRRCLNEICKLLRQPGVLMRQAGISEDAYQSAIQTTLLYVCEKMIDRYEPTKGSSFLRWVRSNFKWRQNDARNEEQSVGDVSLEQLLESQQAEGLVLRADFRRLMERFSEQDTLSLAQELRQFIEDDPEGVFSQAYIGNIPDLNFKIMVLKDVYGFTFRELSEKFSVPIPTISSFRKRKLSEFIPYILDYLLGD